MILIVCVSLSEGCTVSMSIVKLRNPSGRPDPGHGPGVTAADLI